MKFALVLFFLSYTSLFGKDFYTYEEALELQKKNHKIIMLDVIRTKCQYCTNMKNNVLKNQDMKKWMDKRFITVEINLDKEKIPLNLNVKLTPTFYFINERKEVLKEIVGSWSIQDFKDLTKGIK